MRVPVMAGNWKMNKTVAEALELVNGIFYGLKNPGEVDVVVAPPFTLLHPVAQKLKDTYIGVAAQNMHWEDSGAFTGEISGTFIKDVGCDYVIIGHSERRQYFGETDETVNKKVKAAIKNQLIPIVCVGEILEKREAGQVNEVNERQLLGGLDGLTSEEVGDLIIAYEPVWAIGTGKTATPEQAQEVHGFLREVIANNFSSDAADKVRILYGGSMNPKNADELIKQKDIDGGLIGGAALKPESFIELIKIAG
ncbi:triose-phosphate isomerase [bacterium]|nr:triose-phosphate isomerase [bacterium]